MTELELQLAKELEIEAEISKRQKDLRDKELILRTRKANTEIANFDRADQNVAITNSMDLSTISATELDRYAKNNTDYFKSAKNPIPFIGPMFDHKVPFFRNNLILVAAETGQGKSTCVGNIIIEALRAGKRILVLTNEQNAADFYNMVTCMLKGWSYTQHENFTDQQIEILTNNIKYLGGSGRLTVMDDTFGGSSGVTTTIEGIESVFNNLIKNRTHYDMILIDYYQMVHLSSLKPSLGEYEVQRMLCNRLNTYKDAYPAPIVLMAQIKPQLEGETVPFKLRIEGTKGIVNKCTHAMEMVTKKDRFLTEWHTIKSRFNPKMQGNVFPTGFDRGRFVPYTIEFQKEVAKIQDKKMMEHVTKGLPERKKDAEVPKETSPSGSPSVDGPKS